VDCQALEVDYEDEHGERNACSPQDVGHDDSDERVLRVRKDVGDDSA